MKKLLFCRILEKLKENVASTPENFTDLLSIFSRNRYNRIFLEGPLPSFNVFRKYNAKNFGRNVQLKVEFGITRTYLQKRNDLICRGNYFPEVSKTQNDFLPQQKCVEPKWQLEVVSQEHTLPYQSDNSALWNKKKN